MEHEGAMAYFDEVIGDFYVSLPNGWLHIHADGHTAWGDPPANGLSPLSVANFVGNLPRCGAMKNGAVCGFIAGHSGFIHGGWSLNDIKTWRIENTDGEEPTEPPRIEFEIVGEHGDTLDFDYNPAESTEYPSFLGIHSPSELGAYSSIRLTADQFNLFYGYLTTVLRMQLRRRGSSGI